VKIKNIKIFVLLLCLLQVFQLFTTVLACAEIIPPHIPYKAIEIEGFGGDCYARIVYPYHNSYDGIRTEIYESKQDLEPIMVFPSKHSYSLVEHFYTRLYCNRVFEGEKGVVTVVVNTPGQEENKKEVSFYFNTTLKKEYYTKDLLRRHGLETIRESCDGFTLVWDSKHLSTTQTKETIRDDEFGRENWFLNYEKEHVSIINDREVLGLITLDQSILLFDLLTGEFLGREEPSSD